MANDYRTLRDRYDALYRAIDLIPPPREATARRLVSIFDGGAMPASGDHYFSGHPVECGNPEVEGGAPVFSIDPDTVLLVDVLGTTVPAVGDLLVATSVGGRWVAERGGGTPAPSDCCMSPCGSTPIPQVDLELNYTIDFGEGPQPFGPFPMHYEGGQWITDNLSLFAPEQSDVFILECLLINVVFSEFQSTPGEGPGSCSSGADADGGAFFPGPAPPSSSPFSMQWNAGDFEVNPFACSLYSGTLGAVFTVTGPTGPAPGAPLMCQQFTFCPPCNAHPVTVAIYDREGGTLLASQTINGSGRLSWFGSPGPVWIVITSDGFMTITESKTLACAGSQSYALTPNDPLTCDYVNTIVGNGSIALAWTTVAPPGTVGIPVPCWYGVMPPLGASTVTIFVNCVGNGYNVTARTTGPGAPSTCFWSPAQADTYACSPVNIFLQTDGTGKTFCNVGAGMTSLTITGP
jgi:hypothetical protein